MVEVCMTQNVWMISNALREYSAVFYKQQYNEKKYIRWICVAVIVVSALMLISGISNNNIAAGVTCILAVAIAWKLADSSVPKKIEFTDKAVVAQWVVKEDAMLFLARTKLLSDGIKKRIAEKLNSKGYLRYQDIFDIEEQLWDERTRQEALNSVAVKELLTFLK